jgi:hypothetical protein
MVLTTFLKIYLDLNYQDSVEVGEKENMKIFLPAPESHGPVARISG